VFTLKFDYAQGDSEGAKDIASFRFSQQGNYGVLPNKIMPKVLPQQQLLLFSPVQFLLPFFIDRTKGASSA